MSRVEYLFNHWRTLSHNERIESLTGLCSYLDYSKIVESLPSRTRSDIVLFILNNFIGTTYIDTLVELFQITLSLEDFGEICFHNSYQTIRSVIYRVERFEEGKLRLSPSEQRELVSKCIGYTTQNEKIDLILELSERVHSGTVEEILSVNNFYHVLKFLDKMTLRAKEEALRRLVGCRDFNRILESIPKHKLNEVISNCFEAFCNHFRIRVEEFLVSTCKETELVKIDKLRDL